MCELVTPANAGVQSAVDLRNWIPAFAGMTNLQLISVSQREMSWHFNPYMSLMARGRRS